MIVYIKDHLYTPESKTNSEFTVSGKWSIV